MTLIAYHPPKSVSHGHGPRARSPRKVWSAVQEFLSEHTLAELRTPVTLKTWDPSQWTDRAVVEAVRAEAIEMFGAPTRISGEFFNWELPVARLAEALEFAFADENRPKQALGPCDLYVAYSFTWKTMPNPTEPREHFSRGNWLGISFGGRRVFIQPTFLFAASDRDSDFIESLRKLEASMPFKPKDDYYYRVERKKSGNGEKLARLRAGWKNAA